MKQNGQNNNIRRIPFEHVREYYKRSVLFASITIATEQTHSQMKNKKKYHKQKPRKLPYKNNTGCVECDIRIHTQAFYDRTPFTLRSHRFLSTCAMLLFANALERIVNTRYFSLFFGFFGFFVVFVCGLFRCFLAIQFRLFYVCLCSISVASFPFCSQLWKIKSLLFCMERENEFNSFVCDRQ